MTNKQIDAIKNRPLNVGEASRMLGVSRTKIKDLLIAGELEYEFKKGNGKSNEYEISSESCIKWLKKIKVS